MDLIEFQKLFSRAILESDETYKKNFHALVKSKSSVDQSGLSIYQNNFVGTLYKVLKDIFPSILNLVGDNCFRFAAEGYIKNQYCIVGDLNQYGVDFPKYISKILDDAIYLEEVGLVDLMLHQVFYEKDSIEFTDSMLNFYFSQDPEILKVNMSGAVRKFEVSDIGFKLWLVHNPQFDFLEKNILQEKNKLLVWRDRSFSRNIKYLTENEKQLLNCLELETTLYELSNSIGSMLTLEDFTTILIDFLRHGILDISRGDCGSP